MITKKGWDHGFTANFVPKLDSNQKNWSACPPWHILDDGSSNPSTGWDTCVKRGSTFGGNKGEVFEKLFLKFFNESLLN